MFVSTLKNYSRLNEFLTINYKNKLKYGPQNDSMVRLVDPFMLNPSTCKLYGINDPYEEKFNKFTENVDKLEYTVPIHCLIHKKTNMVNYYKNKSNDFRKRSDKLFEINGVSFYGDKEVVYDSIHFIREILTDNKCFSFDEHIVLNPIDHVAEYLVNLYIKAINLKHFDMNDIKFDDLISFLKFIDQYPSDPLNIHSIEDILIQYLDSNAHLQIPCEYIKNICMKYQLKHLYVYIHNCNI